MTLTLQRDQQLPLLSEFAEPLEPVEELYPDCLLLHDFLGLNEQQSLVDGVREWCRGGWHQPPVPGTGGILNHPICGLGMDWVPYEYRPTERPFPEEFWGLCDRVFEAAKGKVSREYRPFRPDTALINWFPLGANLSAHVDRSEDEALREAGSPIITVALGLDCVLGVGGFNRSTKHKRITMRSGDIFLMCGESRMRFHAVHRIVKGTNPGLSMGNPGRISITIRQARRAV